MINFKPFFSALRFLTILPIPESWCGDESDFYRSPDWYPVVGLLIGVLLVFSDYLLRLMLPIPVASVLLLVVMIGISGALHLDGLADSADAFFSSRGLEQMLAIMKDSRSGPMGVTAIVLILLLKLMLLISLPLEWRWQALLLAPLAGRSSLSLVSGWLSYARSTGTAEFTSNHHSSLRPLIAFALLFLASLFFLGMVAGGITFVLIAIAIWFLGSYSRQKIGGFTGDTLGATCEVIELVPLFGIVILTHMGVV